MDAQADEAAVSGKRPADEAVPELAQRVMQLRNVVNMEREHADKLFALLIDTGSLSSDAERIAFLLNRGYKIDPDGKEFLFHAGALADDSEPAVPDGYRLRTAEPGDLEARVELHRIVWAPSRGTVESFTKLQTVWPCRADLDCVVEAPDGSLVAYCLGWLDDANRVGELEPVGTHPDHRRRGLADANRVGELEPVGTHPDHRRRGLAAAACRFALYRLKQEGVERGIVDSLADSDATALYESIDLREHARSLELVKRR